ncbi:hypothetical protein [Streptomyces griseoruber]|uniref:hypothetical protein n=1 Tax=Streptomyces griseoruber TaxID=1943 RepID=UPI003792E541
MSDGLTDLYIRALGVIAGGNVRQVAAALHPVHIASPDGVISPLTVTELARQGWVRIDFTRSLHDGQAIEITQAGLAQLPGNRVPDTVAAGDGPTGDQVLAIALRAAIRYGAVGVDLYDDEVEISGPDDTVLVSIKGRRFTHGELARFLDVDAGDITDAR